MIVRLREATRGRFLPWRAFLVYLLVSIAMGQNLGAEEEEGDAWTEEAATAALPSHEGYIRIDMVMKNASRSQGETIKLDCEMTGDPRPRYTWLKDEQPLAKDSRITMKPTNWGHRLIIRELQPRDAGAYTCVGTNAFGQMSTSMHLRITPPRTDGNSSTNRQDRNPMMTDDGLELAVTALDLAELQAEGVCHAFTGSICSTHFRGQFVVSTPQQNLAERERSLANLFKTVTNMNWNGRRCSTGTLLQALCFYTFPTCSSSTRVPKPLCAADCRALVDDVCRTEVEDLRETLDDDYDFSLLLDCSRLPNATSHPCNSVGVAAQQGPGSEAAVSSAAPVDSSTSAKWGVGEGGELLVIVISSILVVVIVIVGATLTMHFKKRSKRQKKMQISTTKSSFQAIMPSPIPLSGLAIYTLEQVRVLEEVGNGPYWSVRKGLIQGPPRNASLALLANGHTEFRKVYLKVLKDDSNVRMQQDFHREATLINELEHPHLLTSIGICKAPWMIIFEHFEALDLKAFLVQNRNMIGAGKLTNIVQQLAAGMNFLSSRNFVHRDLAARNVLIDANLQCKINDFGIANVQYSSDYLFSTRLMPSGGVSTVLLPIRWMAPESLNVVSFSTETDIWSFGVMVWEIFCFGETPYAGYSNDDVADIIVKGGTNQALACPPLCPPGLYTIVRDCWKMRSDLRPSFRNLEAQFNTFNAALGGVTPNRNHAHAHTLGHNVGLQPFPAFSETSIMQSRSHNQPDDEPTQCLIHSNGHGLSSLNQLNCALALEAKSRSSLSGSDKSHQSTVRKPAASDHLNLVNQTVATPRFTRLTGDEALASARTLNAMYTSRAESSSLITPRIATHALGIATSSRPVLTDQV